MTHIYVGSFLIFSASAMLGFALSRSEKKRQDCSLEFLDFLRMIRDKISYMHLPLNDIYADFDPPALTEIGFTRDLQNEGLAFAYEKHKKRLFFETNVHSFCRKLGSLPLSDTVSLCSYEITRLEKEYDKQMELSEKKRKLYPSLGMLTGLIAVILLL